MYELRPKAQLGGAHHSWLDTKHHFSFANYFDPERMGFGNLRVLNDDTIAAGRGFAPHAHHDMEIVTYVRAGAITHKDSLGNTGRTVAGDVQVMSAGTGITHAEHNAEQVPTKIFQIWLLPRERGLTPRWDTRPFPGAGHADAFVVLASGIQADVEAGALAVAADARVLGAHLARGSVLQHDFAAGHRGYLVVAEGEVRLGDLAVGAGDGVAITGRPDVQLEAVTDAVLILVETR